MVHFVFHERPAEVTTLQHDDVFQPFGFDKLGRILMDSGGKRPANTLQVSVDGLGVLSQQTITLDTGSRHLAASINSRGKKPASAQSKFAKYPSA